MNGPAARLEDMDDDDMRIHTHVTRAPGNSIVGSEADKSHECSLESPRHRTFPHRGSWIARARERKRDLAVVLLHNGTLRDDVLGDYRGPLSVVMIG